MASEVLKTFLKKDKRVAVLTGAGISAESGVPTFRGEDGLWKKFKPEELATFDAFISNPQLVWEWYEYRRKLISEVKPNPAHYSLAEMQGYFESFHLITQNVDGLHQKAGSKEVIELHGNIKRNKCISCDKRFEEIELTSKEMPPKCRCGGLIRPDVVWFGEMLPAEAINKAHELSSKCDIFFSIGTSAVVYPAASLPLIAKKAGAYLVEVNLERTELSHLADEVFLGKAGEIMPEIAGFIKDKD
ncbi:MAG: NAD-dependent deacylase [candidate division Zixibacteria bacterium]|nr:NAD-dependent deacylase [candidate division Zixibacteria bacterium]